MSFRVSGSIVIRVHSMLRAKKMTLSTKCRSKTVSKRIKLAISFKLLLFKLFIFNTMTKLSHLCWGKFSIDKVCFVLCLFIMILGFILEMKNKKVSVACCHTLSVIVVTLFSFYARQRKEKKWWNLIVWRSSFID